MRQLQTPGYPRRKAPLPRLPATVQLIGRSWRPDPGIRPPLNKLGKSPARHANRAVAGFSRAADWGAATAAWVGCGLAARLAAQAAAPAISAGTA